jgi:hypothetical protein
VLASWKLRTDPKLSKDYSVTLNFSPKTEELIEKMRKTDPKFAKIHDAWKDAMGIEEEPELSRLKPLE